ncbi:MAG: hypothetical protein DMF00_06800 [Verrucomicrobia bacterium]|nr:MAG: hypothetical protein DMF00_06800 [Verrucomicrobiota bacterium]
MSYRIRRLTRPAFRPSYLEKSCEERFFSATKCVRGGFVEKNGASRDGLGDYCTALDYESSHLARRIRTAKRSSIFLKSPT